jgi:uncharacterized protein YndB with AHSA1/START domain
MADYQFVTIWRVDAPVERVYEAIRESDKWPEWWPGVKKVEELQAGDAEGVGNLRRYTWKSKLPYELVFEMRTTRVDPPRLLEGVAVGELDGVGCWTLKETAEGTEVRYDWRVKTTKAWMNVLAPIARPFFQWNHDVVMGWGGEGLARRLGARLLSTSGPTR